MRLSSLALSGTAKKIALANSVLLCLSYFVLFLAIALLLPMIAKNIEKTTFNQAASAFCPG